mmetsp:Transcript_4809/g.7305  ORF Transcript_4809/g.7305 Transcript_4809/m.7305 type:complete len:304 (+) Transcript_4809:1-912(+)
MIRSGRPTMHGTMTTTTVRAASMLFVSTQRCTTRLLNFRSSQPTQQLVRRRWNSSSSSSSEEAQRRAYQYYQQKNQTPSFFSSWFRRSRSQKSTPRMSREERSIQMAWYAAATVLGALGATYASVPLYKMFCQATGFGGTTQRVSLEQWASQQEERDQTGISRVWQYAKNVMYGGLGIQSRPNKIGGNVHTWTDEDAAAKLASLKPVENGKLITVRFDSTVGDVLPWTFVPTQLDVKVVPGETALSFFTVSNKSPDKAITGVATYNVHPPKAGLYFNKIQCFCFEEQRLLPGETVDMPVFFFH